MNANGMQTTKPRNALVWLTTSALVIALDQASKFWVLTVLREYTAVPGIEGVWNWYRSYNTGAAFSFLNGAGGWPQVVWKGYIRVDEHWRTNVDGLYAIGDVIGGPMLAHKVTEVSVALAEQLAGLPGHVNYDAIPAVVYTAPEVASVGQTEDAPKAADIGYKVGRFPFSANSCARAKAQTDSFVKVLADATTDRGLGVHIGPEARSLIHEAVVAMEFRGSAENIARSCHAHPTLPEALKEAAMAVDGWALHA